MRIIYPGQTYKEALQLASCPKLDGTCEGLSVKTVMPIYKGGHLAQYVTQTKACAHNFPIRKSFTTEHFKNSFVPNTISTANTKPF